jgi:type I restriction enzyme S subunit
VSLELDRSKWQRVKFGDVVNQGKEKTDPEADGIERYVAGEHMDTDSLAIARYGLVGDGYLGPAFIRRFRKGQVLYGSRRTYLRKVALADFDGVCANTTFVMESSDPNRLLPELLPLVMSTESFHAHSIAESRGSVNPYVNWPDIAKYEFDLPPLDQQRRIADLFWGLETHTRTMSSLLFQSDELRVGLASDICYGNQPSRRLADVLNVVRGGSPRPIHDYLTEDDDGINWIKIGDVPVGGKFITKTAEKITSMGLAKTRRVSRGDLLLSNSMSFGRPYILDIDGCIHDGWLALSDVSGMWRTEYLYYLLRSRQVQAQFLSEAAGSTVKNLNIGIVSNVRIPVPSLEYQDQALSKFEVLEATITAVIDELQSLSELRSSLNRLLVRGGAS